MTSNTAKAGDARALVYLSYGTGPHVDEIIYSILSVHHWIGPAESGIEIIVYTDSPAAFVGLGATIVELDDATLREWAGRMNYAHRRKPEAMRDALARTGGRVAMIDGDTWFRQSPAALFDRIAPGRGILHICEYRLGDHDDPQSQSFAAMLAEREWRDLSGRPIATGNNPAMWNSGVIGVHSSDAGLIDEALHLLDQLAEAAPGTHYIEQFAVGHCLAPLQLAEAADTVFHYWPPHLRDPFKHRLAAVLAEGQGMPLHERAHRAFSARPRASIAAQAKMALKTLLFRLGVPAGGPRASG